MDFFLGFLLGFVSSILASLCFWYFTDRRPRKRDERRIQEHTAIIIRGIIGQGKSVIQTLLHEAGIKKDFEDVIRDDIMILGPRVKLKKQAPTIPGFIMLQGLNFAQYLCFYKERTVSSIQQIFTYIYFLDSELINRLSRILHSGYFILCDAWLKNVHLASEPDLTSFDDGLWEYYLAIVDLDSYAKKHGIWT